MFSSFDFSQIQLFQKCRVFWEEHRRTIGRGRKTFSGLAFIFAKGDTIGARTRQKRHLPQCGWTPNAQNVGSSVPFTTTQDFLAPWLASIPMISTTSASFAASAFSPAWLEKITKGPTSVLLIQTKNFFPLWKLPGCFSLLGAKADWLALASCCILVQF